MPIAFFPPPEIQELTKFLNLEGYAFRISQN